MFVYRYLWIMQEGFPVINTSTSTSAYPPSTEHTFMPSFLETQGTSVHYATHTGMSKPLTPVMKFHPILQKLMALHKYSKEIKNVQWKA